MNIPYAYADLRFNPSFDKQTGIPLDQYFVCQSPTKMER